VHNHGTISFNAELILIHDVLTMCFTTSVRMWDTSVLVYEAIYEATCNAKHMKRKAEPRPTVVLKCNNHVLLRTTQFNIIFRPS